MKMYKREIPKMNKENFLAWKHLILLHLSSVGDSTSHYLDNEYIELPRCMTIEQIKEKHEHNQMMIEMETNLSYVEFDDAKEFTTTNKMWDKLAQIHGGDKNVFRAKEKILRGNSDDLRMKEGEMIEQYCGQIKDVFNIISGVVRYISKEIVVRKVLGNLLPIYAIRVSTIQELRCTLGNDMNLD
jgi:hypothetical protein